MRTISGAVCWLFMTGTVLAAPPRVVEAIPDNGDINVDPNLSEIRITFDQRMDTRGRSIVGGGDSFPEITGEIRWIGAQTIVVPVRLVPDHEYWLSINNQQYRNFANVRGESAVPYPVRFTTGPAGDRPPAADVAPRHDAAVDRVIDVLTSRYAYRDRVIHDWAAVIEASRPTLVACATPEAFAKTLSTVLARGEDKHLWVQAGGERLPTFFAPPVPNADAALLPRIIPGYERLSRTVAYGRWHDDVGYIAADSWDGSDPDAVEAVFEALWHLHDTRALIIDVRLNGGGDELLAREFAGCFIDEPVVYAKNRFVDPSSADGFGPVLERTLEPSKRRARYAGPVAVLSGPAVMSSCEAFVLMMRAAPRAVVVGGRTQGSSGNPRPHELGNGVTLWVPSWQAMTPDGLPFEGLGIEPDVHVKTTPALIATEDPVIRRALEHLNR